MSAPWRFFFFEYVYVLSILPCRSTGSRFSAFEDWTTWTAFGLLLAAFLPNFLREAEEGPPGTIMLMPCIAFRKFYCLALPCRSTRPCPLLSSVLAPWLSCSAPPSLLSASGCSRFALLSPGPLLPHDFIDSPLCNFVNFGVASALCYLAKPRPFRTDPA